MAKTSAKKPERDREQQAAQGKVQFLNYDLDEETRKSFKAWANENVSELLNLSDKLVEDGYGISIKFDGYNSCIGAFVSCKKPGHAHENWILSGRGSSAFSALAGVLYRHFVIFDGVWPIENLRRGTLDDD